MPKVSIIVPVYNAECYLRKCLDSIINQDFKDWELLLIDDGSTDTSLSICQKYSKFDNRIFVFHKDNGGVSSARNYCLKEAKGEWIAFVDADDWLEPNYLTDLLQCEDSDMVIGGYKNEQHNNKITDKRKTLEIKDIDFSEKETNKIFYFPWRRIYRKNIIYANNICFDEKMRLSEDTCFTIYYLAFCKRIGLSSECNYIYRTNDSSKYILNYEEFKTHCDKLKEAVVSFFTKTGISLSNIEQNISSNYFYYYKDYLNTINTYNKYANNVKEWTRPELLSFLHKYMQNQSVLKNVFYYILISFPRIGYVLSRTSRRFFAWQR